MEPEKIWQQAEHYRKKWPASRLKYIACNVVETYSTFHQVHRHKRMLRKHFPQFYACNLKRLPAKYPSLQVEYCIMLQKKHKALGTYRRRQEKKQAEFKIFAAKRALIAALARKTLTLKSKGMEVAEDVRDLPHMHLQEHEFNEAETQTQSMGIDRHDKAVQVPPEIEERLVPKVSQPVATVKAMVNQPLPSPQHEPDNDSVDQAEPGAVDIQGSPAPEQHDASLEPQTAREEEVVIPDSPPVQPSPQALVTRSNRGKNKENKTPAKKYKQRASGSMQEEREAWFGFRAGIIKNFGKQAQTSKNISKGTGVSLLHFKKAKEPVFAIQNKDGSKTLVSKEEIRQLRPHVKKTPSSVFALENRNTASKIRWRLSVRYRVHRRLTVQWSRRKSEGQDLSPMPILRRTSTISKLINFFFDSAMLHGVEVIPYMEEQDPEQSSDEFYEKVMAATETNQAMQEAICRDTTNLQIQAAMEEDITPFENVSSTSNVHEAKRLDQNSSSSSDEDCDTAMSKPWRKLQRRCKKPAETATQQLVMEQAGTDDQSSSLPESFSNDSEDSWSPTIKKSRLH